MADVESTPAPVEDIKEETMVPVEESPAEEVKVPAEKAAKPEPAGSRRSGRSRKTVEKLVYAVKEKKEKIIIPGSGTPLGDIENIKTLVGKAKNEDLMPLHRVLYGSDGKKTIRKRQIRAFSGFQESETDQFKKRLERLKTDTLRFIMTVLDLKKSSDKTVMIDGCIAFLANPDEESTAQSKTPALKRKRGKGKKSKSGSTRGPSSYMLYTASIRPEVTAANPEKKMTELAKIFGEKWRSLSDAEKQVWKNKASASVDSSQPKKKKAKKAKKMKKKKVVSDEEEETDSDDEDKPLGKGESIEDKLSAAIKDIMSSIPLADLTVRKIKDKLKKDFGEDVVAENKKFIKAFVKSECA